jgi:hypothetical protein
MIYIGGADQKLIQNVYWIKHRKCWRYPSNTQKTK